MIASFLRDLDTERLDKEAKEAYHELNENKLTCEPKVFVQQPSVRPDIRVHDKAACAFCEDSVHKYKCPRCQKLYCTLKCYNSAGHKECVESFCKDQVTEALKQQSASQKTINETNQKLLEEYRGDN